MKARTANNGLAIAGRRSKFRFFASIKICILVESFGFDLPAIAKPRNVVRHATRHQTQP